MNQDKRRFSQEQWARLLAETVQTIQALAKVKGGEYSGDSDRLANFRRLAAEQQLPMETIWRVYAGKHWDSLNTYIMDLRGETSRPRSEPIAGRAHDLLVYLLLFLAMLEEREAGKPKALTFSPQPVQRAEGPEPLRVLEGGKFDPVCPGTGAAHQWGRIDRYTDGCIACPAMRPHERRR